ncbi:hypothetical protein INT44_004448 [Umbelopsis vinacea]|uniref:Uncharacterized protein n=1 Tax=Umbelopsis vinacea TaxID=44442 RepID=A0A8H7UKF9_9FUNG|nr:hypothetical protein INT44_004448 [Umbelopsis vinacea]
MSDNGEELELPRGSLTNNDEQSRWLSIEADQQKVVNRGHSTWCEDWAAKSCSTLNKQSKNLGDARVTHFVENLILQLSGCCFIAQLTHNINDSVASFKWEDLANIGR